MSGYNLPQRRLVSQEDASMVARPDIPRSKFSGSFSVKFTGNAGYLMPFHVEEVYPGDHFRYNFTPFVRTSTPLFPIMDSQRVDVHCFFVPNRLVWNEWVKLMGEQANPNDSIAVSVPQVTSTGNGFAVLGVGDYMGLPTVGQQVTAPLSVSELPFRAYNMVYNQWYRDENLVNSRPDRRGSTGTTEADYALLKRAKSHDYFTSCLPWPQKFVAPVMRAPVSGLGVEAGGGQAQPGPFSASVTPSVTNPSGLETWPGVFPGAGPQTELVIRADSGDVGALPQVYADLDVNMFRQAMQVQVFLERMARGGSRYTEITDNIFGVKNPDARLQRAEYIGGGSTPIQFTPIAQTAALPDNPLGALGAAGTAVGSASASYAATEHGFILCIASVKSELSYSQGIHRMWDRKVLYDYYNPAFVGLGEQAVFRREIYATGVDQNDAAVFGYQERFHELRTHSSSVRGLFRPGVTGAIPEWHLSQQFDVPPVLGQTFIEDTPPMDRVYAAGDEAAGVQYLFDVHVRTEMVRPLSTFGTPVGLGRF